MPAIAWAQEQPPCRHHAEQSAIVGDDVEVDDAAFGLLRPEAVERLGHGLPGVKLHEVAAHVLDDRVLQVVLGKSVGHAVFLHGVAFGRRCRQFHITNRAAPKPAGMPMAQRSGLTTSSGP